MVSESICLDILRFVRGKTLTTDTSKDEASPSAIYRHLLGKYQLSYIDSAMRWLDLGNYIGKGSAGYAGLILSEWYALTDKGREAADHGRFSDDERRLLYQEEDPYAVFVAYQFNNDDTDIVTYIRDKVLVPNGFKFLDGRVEGLEEFRTRILQNIRRARFFLCLLTKRLPLAPGTYASSVWLYQETGVAVAYGKKPLLLVEEGIDSQYVGELQGIYERITFTRSNHPSKFEAISRRLLNDLEANLIPKPAILHSQ